MSIEKWLVDKQRDVSEGNNANHHVIFNSTPHIALLEYALSKEPSVFLRCVAPGQPRQSMIERDSVNARSSIHIQYRDSPEHRELPAVLVRQFPPIRT
jgi:hypothetical protein